MGSNLVVFSTIYNKLVSGRSVPKDKRAGFEDPTPGKFDDRYLKPRMIDLPRICDTRGNLTFVEQNRHVPFDIKRVYYLYDVPGGESRGGHAHKKLQQFIIAASGSFDVLIDDGHKKERFHLNRSYNGLYIPIMVWRELDNFSSGSVCLVLASEYYNDQDYIKDYGSFQKLVLGSSGND